MREKEKERERGDRYRETVYVGDWRKRKRGEEKDITV